MRTSSRRHTGHIPSKRCRFRIERDLGRRSLQTWFFRIHTRARLPPSRPQGLRLGQTGGASRDRTDDLMLAKQPLSQLSYGPILVKPQAPAGTSVPSGFRARGRGGRSALPNLTVREAGERTDRRVQMVGLGRLERPTSPLSGVRSNHLSYRPKRIEDIT